MYVCMYAFMYVRYTFPALHQYLLLYRTHSHILLPPHSLPLLYSSLSDFPLIIFTCGPFFILTHSFLSYTTHHILTVYSNHCPRCNQSILKRHNLVPLHRCMIWSLSCPSRSPCHRGEEVSTWCDVVWCGVMWCDLMSFHIVSCPFHEPHSS